MNEVFRKEIKYPISLLDFYSLQKRLECFVQPDPHSDRDGYHIRSLYFDSVNDGDLFDAMVGNMEKRKIRLRFYPPDDGYIRMECKYKSGSDGVKHSVILSKDEAQCMMRGDYSLLMDLKQPFASELYCCLKLGGYLPKVVVDYHRIAYVYPVSYTRLNFDSAISASYVTDSFFDSAPGLIPLISPDMGVFEVKYDHFLVGVLKEILAPLDSLASANSKYVDSRFSFNY